MINNNSSKRNNKDIIINQQNNLELTIDELDQKLIELLLKGYTHKKIALEAKSPLSTIHRRIRKLCENEYIYKKNELNYKKLVLRKGYLLISLKGDHSGQVAQKISSIKGITCVSLMIGSIDILSTCIFKDTNDLFRIIESTRAIERVNNVSWSEEVHSIPAKETMMLSFQESVNDL